MKIGLLLAVYKDSQFINHCLQPWVEYNRINDSNVEIKTAVVHGMFKEYHELGFKDEDKETINQLIDIKNRNSIDYLYIQNLMSGSGVYENEAELRNRGLKWLLDQNIDYLWILDADEIYSIDEIFNIIDIIKSDNLYDWYRVYYKNYVFDNKHYIKGFCPPRIWNNKRHGGIDKFYWDNDICYKDGSNYKELSCKVIPESKAFVKHYTWLENDKSRDKILYHKLHFKNGFGCSYKWENNKLLFNDEYYKLTNQIKPEVFTEND